MSSGKVLVVSTCAQQLHYFEFVKPIEDILSNAGFAFDTVALKDLNEKHWRNCSKAIICGTSLKDFSYLKLSKRLSFLRERAFEKPVLGICAGMQLLCVSFGCSLRKAGEIGLTDVFFSEKFLGLERKVQAYSLHSSAVKDSASLRKAFRICASSECCLQAVKHLQKPFYGVLFHPEARQKQLVEEFARL